ncbi:hypothetical protein FB451DRAFT_1189001 [Mycena latifolia]|nr:hypothetical protein FB451DRAFT_1189001 [Mycena latifolia]
MVLTFAGPFFEAPGTSCLATLGPRMRADDAPSRAETPSPDPVEQPSSGPNPIFESPPKKIGGQPTSIRVEHRRLAEKDKETILIWSPQQTTPRTSSILFQSTTRARSSLLTPGFLLAISSNGSISSSWNPTGKPQCQAHHTDERRVDDPSLLWPGDFGRVYSMANASL